MVGRINIKVQRLRRDDARPGARASDRQVHELLLPLMLRDDGRGAEREGGERRVGVCAGMKKRTSSWIRVEKKGVRERARGNDTDRTRSSEAKGGRERASSRDSNLSSADRDHRWSRVHNSQSLVPAR